MIISSENKKHFAEYISKSNKNIRAFLFDIEEIEIHLKVPSRIDINELGFCIAEVSDFIDKGNLNKKISCIHFNH